jgi:hypothetical protein
MRVEVEISMIFESVAFPRALHYPVTDVTLHMLERILEAINHFSRVHY